MKSGATSNAKGRWLASMYATLTVVTITALQLQLMLHAQLDLLAGFVSTNSFQACTVAYITHKTIASSRAHTQNLEVSVGPNVQAKLFDGIWLTLLPKRGPSCHIGNKMDTNGMIFLSPVLLQVLFQTNPSQM